MTFRFGNDETLETRTLVILPVGIAGVSGVLRMVCGAWESVALTVEGIFERPSVATLIWVAGTYSLRSWECEQWWQTNSRRICFYP